MHGPIKLGASTNHLSRIALNGSTRLIFLTDRCIDMRLVVEVWLDVARIKGRSRILHARNVDHLFPTIAIHLIALEIAQAIMAVFLRFQSRTFF